MAKKKIKKSKVKELYDLEIDEVSAVDMAAIGESFYLTKSVNKKNKKGAKVAKGKKLPLTKAVQKWSVKVEKANADKCGEHCHFCGVTKELEDEKIGAGLRNGVCIECALEHFEKGVFDECCTFQFDIEKFKSKYPDVQLHELSKDSEEEDADSEDDADDEEDADSEDDAEKSTNNTANVDNEEGEGGLESDQNDLSKRVDGLEKSLEDVSGMLERSLELHDVAADAFNEVVSLTFASLDMVMAMIEERMEEGESEQAVEQRSIFSEINDNMKSVREEVTKAGRKISGKRMSVLREIAEKLSELITSVMNDDAKKGVTKNAVNEIEKSLNSFKEEIKEDIKSSSSSLKEDIETKLKDMASKLDDLEQSGGGSYGLGDDEEDEEEYEDDHAEKGESVFADVVGLGDISKSIEKKRRNLNR
jgi:hypothetical protein